MVSQQGTRNGVDDGRKVCYDFCCSRGKNVSHVECCANFLFYLSGMVAVFSAQMLVQLSR